MAALTSEVSQLVAVESLLRSERASDRAHYEAATEAARTKVSRVLVKVSHHEVPTPVETHQMELCADDARRSVSVLTMRSAAHSWLLSVVSGHIRSSLEGSLVRVSADAKV